MGGEKKEGLYRVIKSYKEKEVENKIKKAKNALEAR